MTTTGFAGGCVFADMAVICCDRHRNGEIVEMENRKNRILLPILAVLFCVTIGCWFHKTRIEIEGKIYERDIAELNLSGTSVEDVEKLAEMKYCVDLVCLDMGHMGISDYSFLEYMPNMKYLVLCGTNGTDFSALANLKELVFLELFMTEFDQAEVLTGLTKLEDLNLGNSEIENIEPLKEMTWLKRLWLPGARKVPYAEREALQGALADTIVNFMGVGSTDQGWRESPNYYAMRDLLGMGYMKGYGK